MIAAVPSGRLPSASLRYNVRASPSQVHGPNVHPILGVGAFHEMAAIAGCRFVPAFQALGKLWGRGTWAAARPTRFSPGYHMTGLQP